MNTFRTKGNKIKPVFVDYKESLHITLNNGSTLFLLQNKTDETDVKGVVFDGVGEDIDFNSFITEFEVDFSSLVDSVLGYTDN